MIEKAISLTFVFGILALQLWVIFPPGSQSNHWYWPFVNYPMYSQAKLPGEVFMEHAIRVRFGSEDSARRMVQSGAGKQDLADRRTVSVSYDDLRIRQFVFYRSLARIDSWASGRGGWRDEQILEEMRLLELSISEFLSPHDSLVLVKRDFPIGRRGLEDRDPPWQVVHAWASQVANEAALARRAPSQ
jgi:hypothetical protein